MDIFDTETETLISVNNPCIYEGDCISVGDKIYHFGGNSTSIRVYNIKTNTWEYCPISLTSKRERVSIASVGSKIYLFGGRATDNYKTRAYDSIYIFDTENLTIQNSSVNLPSSIYGISTIAIGTAATDATNKANKALEYAKSHVTEVLAGLEGSVSVSSNRHVLTGVTEAGGKLTGKAEVELSNIAFSGTTDDLEQGTKTLVFSCGSSTI